MDNAELSRRNFLKSAAVVGAGAVLAGAAADVLAQDSKPAAGASDELNVAIIGPGNQGRNLIKACFNIPGIRFVALADIWPYHQEYAANLIKAYKQKATVYTDYQDMLAKEKSIDAVIVSSPDWLHSEQTCACLEAGKHVYCEKEMSNTIEGARKMVLAARKTGKLLQIGHQRRSNPRYVHGLKMIDKDKILGRVTNAFGQWNRPISATGELGWPKTRELSADVLKKYGYDSMLRFRNWRWFRQFSGGAFADLGSHQIDIFNWFLHAQPTAVTASGSLDYYKDRDWPDNVMAIYEYATATGNARAFYQILSTTSYGGYYEAFMGDEGTMEISEDVTRGKIFREVTAKRREWEDEATRDGEAIKINVGASLGAGGKKSTTAQAIAAGGEDKNIHQLHLENFFSAVRKGTPLSCPSEVAFETAVTVLKAEEAIAAGKRVEFKPEDFKA